MCTGVPFHPRGRLDQGGLSRPIVTDEGGDLTIQNVEVDIPESLHGTEALGYAVQAQQGAVDVLVGLSIADRCSVAHGLDVS